MATGERQPTDEADSHVTMAASPGARRRPSEAAPRSIPPPRLIPPPARGPSSTDLLADRTTARALDTEETARTAAFSRAMAANPWAPSHAPAVS